MGRRLVFVVALMVAGAAVAEEPDGGPPYGMYPFLYTLPTIDRCFEYHYEYEKDCPDGYGPVIVNTPTSDAKSAGRYGGWCKESFGAVIECGRVVEATEGGGDAD